MVIQFTKVIMCEIKDVLFIQNNYSLYPIIASSSNI